MVKKITQTLSENTTAKITISSVDLALFNNLLLRDLCIREKNGDTILYTQKFITGIYRFSSTNRVIKFNKVKLKNSIIHFKTDSSGVINFQFILDKLVSTDSNTKKGGWIIGISNIYIIDSKFTYQSYYLKEQSKGINFTDLELTNLNVFIRDFYKSPFGDVRMDINSISCIEKSGFIIKDFISKLEITNTKMNFKFVEINTDKSKLIADEILLTHKHFRDWGKGQFYNKVKLKLDIKPSTIHFSELSFFLPKLKLVNQEFKISGLLKGSVENLKGFAVLIELSDTTKILGSFNLTGLPAINKTYISYDIEKLTTNAKDINELYEKFKSKIKIPSFFYNLGKINYKGNFTGFIDDFVAYGNIKTEAGNLAMDISLKPDSLKNIKFKGNISAKDLNIGKILQQEKFGNISFSMILNGNTLSNKGIRSLIQASINELYYNQYAFQNIKIKGVLKNKTYDGSVIIKDKNLDVDFFGGFDFSRKIPEFDFSADIKNANLFILDIDKKDSLSTLACGVRAEFFPNDSSHLSGDINIYNLKLAKKNKNLAINDFKLFTKNKKDTNYIYLESDYVDAVLSGKYDFKTIQSSFSNYISHYLPSINKYYEKNPDLTKNNFKFSAIIKDIEPICNFYYPGLYIAEETTINGFYYPVEQNSSLRILISKFEMNGKVFENLLVKSFKEKEKLALEVTASNFFISKKINLKNFKTAFAIYHDSIELKTHWYDYDSTATAADFESFATIKRTEGRKKPIIQIHVLPTTLIQKDSLWNISTVDLELDSSSIAINDFTINNKKQLFNISGKISENKEDQLTVFFKEFNIANLNYFAKQKNIEINGFLDGKASLRDIYKNPTFNSDFTIDTLFINKEAIGNTTIYSEWDNAEKKVKINLISTRGKIKTLEIKGKYTPENRNLNFDIEMNKLKIDILKPYLSTIFSNIRGLATGTGTLTGTLQDPFINGEIQVQKASFLVNYLKTKYYFTDNLFFKNNKLLFNNVTLYDQEGNKGSLDGNIFFYKLKLIEFDLKTNFTNVLCLNTVAGDNEYFYGKGYATGFATLTGVIRNIKMGINIKSEKNSIISIPMTRNESISDNSYILFTDKTQQKIKKVKVEKVSEVEVSGLEMDFDLDVTPDAYVQIIFDSKVGDMIRGYGSGNIKMGINTKGKFNIYGDYNINSGDYLFTLQNVVNKRFDILKGGRIWWTGDPYEAEIDAQADYKTKAPLSNLFNDTSQTYKKRVPVECQIFLTRKLMSPDIRLGINLPTVDAETQSKAQAFLNDEDNLSVQFLGLLILNNFLKDDKSSATYAQGSDIQSSGAVTTSELLSNQLNYWLSQYSKKFDIGFNYRPGDQVTSDELEVALSTQLINDRVSVSGNLDMGGTQTTNTSNTSNIVGDFNVDVKLNKSGKLRVQAFNRENDKLVFENSQYTQGVGLIYREEFNTFGELVRKYWGLLTGRKPEDTNLVDKYKEVN